MEGEITIPSAVERLDLRIAPPFRAHQNARTDACPAERVAAQPPSETYWNDCGKWPIV